MIELTWFGGTVNDLRKSFAETESGRYFVDPHPTLGGLYRSWYEADDYPIGGG